MGKVELWLGPASCGKTGQALAVLRDELRRDWRGVRYLVPTVGHKRSIEHLLLTGTGEQSCGLLGDPLTTFFNFAEEVARRANVRGQQISELQKYLLLKRKVREARLRFFDRARRYPGFVQTLSEAIDELKVHMVWSDELLAAAEVAREHQFLELAQKLAELGGLYQSYQQQVIAAQLYDSEGIMWLAAECLQQDAQLFGDLRCLILDGFARLTPIQVEFLRRLAPRIERTIVLFDFEEGRSESYHPVLDSLRLLEIAASADGLRLEQRALTHCLQSPQVLPFLRREIFRGRATSYPCDASLGMFLAATPAQETEMIARDIRALLRAGSLPEGGAVTPADIAILARDAGAVYPRFARTFARYGLVLCGEPAQLAHTSVGRAMLASLRLVRDGWRREELLLLLKSGFLDITPTAAFHIDLVARRHALRDGKTAWLERWPDEEGASALQQAFLPLLRFDAVYHTHEADAEELLAAAGELLNAFRATGLPATPPLPEVDPAASARYLEWDAAFTHTARVFRDLRNLGALLGGYRREEMVEVINTALLRETLPAPAQTHDGISLLSVHATGGEKFKVVFLCNLRQGVFPRHLRESAFLLDHERDEALPKLHVHLEGRRHLENDEQYWFLHALSSATHRLVLSYASHDADGSPGERSSFLDEVERLVPGLRARARVAAFRDIVPPLAAAESEEEFLAGLVLGLRGERDAGVRKSLAAAYAVATQGTGLAIPQLFRLGAGTGARLCDAEILTRLSQRHHAFSASELQGYVDCPFLWFAQYCLRVATVIEEFGPLDRGQILHGVLERFYRSRQEYDGQPVHLETALLDDVWPEVERDLEERLAQEPRFANKAKFLRDIEWESLRRMLRRFIVSEIRRAGERQLHPAYFEQRFDRQHSGLLWLGDHAISLQGVIDRIDVPDDDHQQAVVVDYKSSAGMSLRDMAGGKVLQAPIYALAIANVFGRDPIGVEFMGIKQADARGIYRQEIADFYHETKGMKLLPAEGWGSLLRECEARLLAAATDIAAGRIVLAPTTKRCPLGCDYLPLCRGDRYALERLVRLSGEEQNDDGE